MVCLAGRCKKRAWNKVPREMTARQRGKDHGVTVRREGRGKFQWNDEMNESINFVAHSEEW